MNRSSIFIISVFIVLLSSCKTTEISSSQDKGSIDKVLVEKNADFIVSFGSCNKQDSPQPLWDAIAELNPDIFIWGGDVVYADTEDMKKMANDYQTQLNNPSYKKFLEQIEHKVYGTWDDHDYGLNDGGEEWPFKAESQQLFFDFLGLKSEDKRRKREGVYHSETFNIRGKKIKLLILDTRYFRSGLQKDTASKKRYKPWKNGEGTLLGERQWSWFENEIKNSNADYHIIVSSIQIWSDEHGFESWGNFPHEVKKLQNLLSTQQPSNVVLLSGDRHISEFSSVKIENYDYPIFDFTSSGLTHAYKNFSSEPNADRVGEVVATESFGVLKYYFKNNSVLMQMRNEKGVLQAYELKF